MPRIQSLQVKFCELIPETLDDGVLYVAMELRAVMHNCCCGCGLEVATPLGPTEYEIDVRDGSATLYPSIGNHDFPCKSHYWIRGGVVVWSYEMDREEIEEGRSLDRKLKQEERERAHDRATSRWGSIGRAVRRFLRK